MYEIISNISPYGALGVLGFLFGFIYIFYCSKANKIPFSDLAYLYVWSGIGAIIGAKILYCILNIRLIINAIANNQTEILQSVISGGFVFYGGLFGAIIAYIVSANYFSLNKRSDLGVLVPTMPLVHAFGRIGCSIVGCCYGREIHHGLGLLYNNSIYAPNNTLLFPVQTLEAVSNLIIFFILLKSSKTTGLPETSFKKQIVRYLLLYSGSRFILEFFRGDTYRGYIGYLSVSQWISIAIWLSVGLILISNSLKNNKIH